MKVTNAYAAASLNAVKSALDGGRLYYFAGTVPGEAGDALDMGTTHTQCVELTVGGDGSTGLTFESATGPSLVKAVAEEWKGLVAFDGAQAGETTLTPTFWRFCVAGDNGRDATLGVRVQGAIGGPSSSAEIKLTDGTTLTANGTNTRSLPVFSIDLLLI